MLYTEDFTMRHYVGFSQIGSQLCFPLTQASIVALINNSKPSSPRQQKKNNLTTPLELNIFLSNGSWGRYTLTSPHLNHQIEVVISSWNFRGMAKSIKVCELYQTELWGRYITMYVVYNNIIHNKYIYYNKCSCL